MKKMIFATVLIGVLCISCSEDNDNLHIGNTCDAAADIISEEDFEEIDTSIYTLTEIDLNGDCLEVTLSDSGCDPEPWEMNLFSVDAFYTVDPMQRTVKIQLINEQLCQAVFQKTVSFDITPFQIDGQNEVPLNIEGWDEAIVYEY
ncbi:MAG TPA: hypothetical protein VK021_01500 [Flavobacteriaceae bacterium]|nr:hypothetical protein [Flavobacteriaceae bacterium]